MEKSMDLIPDNECVRIVSADRNAPLFTRLTEIGWIPGMCAEIYMRAPLGDPLAILVNGSVFAVRLSDLKSIFVVSEVADACP